MEIKDILLFGIVIGLVIKALIVILYKIGFVSWYNAYAPQKILMFSVSGKFCVICVSFWFACMATIAMIFLEPSAVVLNWKIILMPFIAVGITTRIGE